MSLDAMSSFFIVPSFQALFTSCIGVDKFAPATRDWTKCEKDGSSGIL